MVGDEAAVEVVDAHPSVERDRLDVVRRRGDAGPSSAPTRRGSWTACRPCAARPPDPRAQRSATRAATPVPRRGATSGTAHVSLWTAGVDLATPVTAGVCSHRPGRRSPATHDDRRLGVADEVLDDAFRLGVGRMTEVRGEPVVRREPDVVRCRDHHVATTPPFRQPIRSASTLAGHRRSCRSSRRASPASTPRSRHGRRARTGSATRPAPRRTPSTRSAADPQSITTVSPGVHTAGRR